MNVTRKFYLLLTLIFVVEGCQNNAGHAHLQNDHKSRIAEYIDKNTGKVLVEIPEIFELANIAIAISQPGLEDPYRVRKQGAYYNRVLEHFASFKNHPLIAQDDLNLNYGYFFRDNSICYTFRENKIVREGLYPDMRSPDLFGKHLDLLEDFARVTNFRKFYRDNLPYYDEQIRLYRELVPIRSIWTWLENRFDTRHDCYKVVFSPLLGSSHETCPFEKNGFSQTIMFISGPGEPNEHADPFKRALLAKTVFTEIDHNYVNRVTAKHAARVDNVFADLPKWKQQQGYPSAQMVFNEYMTWALFVLYAQDNYDRNTFDRIKDRVVDQMIHGRKFVKFAEFTDQLLKIYSQKAPEQSIPELYPAILDCAEKTAHSPE